VVGEYIPEGTTTPRGFRSEIILSDALEQLIRTNVRSVAVETKSNVWSQVLISLLPILLLVGVIYFLFSRQLKAAGRGALQFGKSRARLMTPSQERVTFKDVSGVEEAQEEVQEIIDYLMDPPKFQRLGGRIPKGVLMIGPPGTGKTLLARAIAGEADVPFFSISGSDFVEMFVGVGASRVRDMFEEGKRHAPCIIFIDEIDAVGRSRFSGIGGGHDEREQTLNALLVEMDGFESNSGIIVVAATNRPDVLDPALLRPGRFDRQISIDLPDLKGRLGILKVHGRKVELSPDADLEVVARGTPGFSGADLANLINESALLAARQNKKSIEMADLEEARDKVRWGKERRSRKIDEKDRRVTAFHEAGHALARLLCESAIPLHKVTIVPRGTAYLGATMHLPEQDRYTESRSELLDELCVLMAGRVAEEQVIGDITSGAAMDLRQATKVAREMVCTWGMSDILGPVSYSGREDHIFLGRDITRSEDYSEETARQIDLEIRRILTEAIDRTRLMLQENRGRLELLGETLLERDTLAAAEVRELLGFPQPEVTRIEPVDPETVPSTEGEDVAVGGPDVVTTEDGRPAEGPEDRGGA
jgi:cell division protease FtsH